MSHSPFLIGGGLLPPVEFVVQLYVPGHDLHLKILLVGAAPLFSLIAPTSQVPRSVKYGV